VTGSPQQECYNWGQTVVRAAGTGCIPCGSSLAEVTCCHYACFAAASLYRMSCAGTSLCEHSTASHLPPLPTALQVVSGGLQGTQGYTNLDAYSQTSCPGPPPNPNGPCKNTGEQCNYASDCCQRECLQRSGCLMRRCLAVFLAPWIVPGMHAMLQPVPLLPSRSAPSMPALLQLAAALL
jgi:hypothetical protein